MLWGSFYDAINFESEETRRARQGGVPSNTVVSSAKKIVLRLRCFFTTKNFLADKVKSTISPPDDNELVFCSAHDRIDFMKIPVVIAENDYAMMCLYHGSLTRHKIF